MCGDSSGPLDPYSPLSAGLWLSQLTGSVSIVAYLMSWWTLPPADTGKVTEQYTSQPPPSLRPVASQPVCRNTAIIYPASPSLSLHLIYMLFHIHTLHSLTYLLSIPWISSCDSLIYVHIVHSRSLVLFLVIPWEAYPTFISFFLLPSTIFSEFCCLALLSPTLTHWRPQTTNA